MRLLLTLFGLAILPWNLAQGNPLVIDGERRPIKMTSEQVTVDVAPTQSLVTGHYSFQQEPDDWTIQPDKYVLIYLPIILSEKEINSYNKQYQAPHVTVGSRTFTARFTEELGMVGQPEPVKLPKGWVVRLYEAKIPLSLIGPRFDVSISYVQPNFPGDTVAYIPFFPPHSAESASVSFVSSNGYGLTQAGFLSSLFYPQPRLEFRPLDRKMIAVRLKSKK